MILTFQGLLLIITNLLFLFPAFRAYGRALYLFGTFYALVPFTSGSFHACDEFQSCLFSFTFQKNLDYFFAMLFLPMAGLIIIKWNQMWKPLQDVLLLLFALLLAFVLYWGGGSYGAMILFAGIALLLPIVYWAGYMASACIDYPEYSVRAVCCCAPEIERAPGGRYFPKYHWGNLFAGVALTANGVVLFIMQTTLAQEWWWIIHSLWHCAAAFGQWYLLGCKAPPPIASYHLLGCQQPLKPHQKALLKDHLYRNLIHDITRDPLKPIEVLIHLK
jgi:hypothetical protein